MSFDRRQFLAATGACGAAQLLSAPVTAAAKDEVAKDKVAKDELNVASLGKTDHTKFAVNVEMWWTRLPFLDRFRKAAEFGFAAIEMWPYQGRDVDAIAKLTKELKIDIAQFTCWGFTPGMNHPDNEDEFVKTVEEGCQVAHRLACNKMCVVAGNNQPGMTQEQMHAQVIKALRRAAPIAEKEKVTLILEPMNGRVDHPGHCLYGSTDTLRICREVNSPFVKINWDLYHMQISEGDLCGHMKEGFDQIGYLQLADHPGRHEPGTGEIHYNRVLRQAYELGYRDYVGLELVPTDEVAAARAVALADKW